MLARRTFAPCFLALAWPVVSAAQPASQTFEHLSAAVAIGDTLELTDAAGAAVTGRLLQIRPRTLTLDVEGESRTWVAADVRLVTRRWADPLWNGALIGAVVGAAAGAVPVLADCWNSETGSLYDRCHANGGDFAAWCLAGAGGGAALGALVDHWRPSRQTVFEGGGPTVALQPVVTPGSNGLLVRIRF